MIKNILFVNPEIEVQLKINKRKRKTESEKIIEIFKFVEKELNKKELSIDEITAAYYNLYTVEKNEKIKDKQQITVLLSQMKGKEIDGMTLIRLDNGKLTLIKN